MILAVAEEWPAQSGPGEGLFFNVNTLCLGLYQKTGVATVLLLEPRNEPWVDDTGSFVGH